MMKGKLKIWIPISLVALLVALIFPMAAQATITVEPQIAAGYYHTVGLKSDGTVVAVGRYSEGQCDVTEWSGILQVAAGALHTVGLKLDGTVVAVGDNDYDQLNVDGWSDIIQVAAGVYHTVGLKSDGTAVAVGYNIPYGQCNVGGWSDIIQVAAGGWHTVGLKSDRTAVAVGWNNYGQCSNVGGWSDIIQVAAGDMHTVGLKSDRTVVAVGRPDQGQCDVDDWSDITQVAAGCFHTVGLKSDGTVVAEGWDLHGQCNVGGWSDITQIAAGDSHTVGLKSDGTVVAVGRYSEGQCDVDDWWLPTCYEEGYQAGMESCADTIAQLQAEIDELNNLLAAYCDTTPPAGSVHAYPNLIWPPTNKMVEVTLSGYVCDELSIARDGGGIGVSSAYLRVNWEETIPLVIDDGSFSVTKEFEARAGAFYTVELYAADTKPEEDGGPNFGLIDQTYIRVHLDVGI